MIIHPQRRVLRVIAIAATLLLAGLVPATTVRAAPVTYAVGTTTDDATLTTCSSTPSASCSLRGAVADANAAGANAVVTITVPTGTYNITQGELDLFGADGQNFTISGAGAGATVINGDGNHLIFAVNYLDPTQLSILHMSGMSIQNGYDNSATSGLGVNAGFGGGALLAGGNGNQVTIDGCAFSNNRANDGAGGAIQYFGDGSDGETLTVTNSTFDHNTIDAAGSGSFGGAIDFNGGTSFSVSNSTFTNNTAGPSTPGQGGAIATGSSAAGISNPLTTITNSTFTNNTASGTGAVGGAIWNHSGNLSLHDNRIVDNTPSSSQVYQQSSVSPPSSTSATDNWWGINTNPSGFVAGSPPPTVNPWMTLRTTPASSTVNYGQSTTLTASFLKDSNNTTLTTANVSALVGVPVTWANTQHGTLSNQQTTIQSSGMATATFTAGSISADCGATGGAEAKVDHIPDGDTLATATVTTQCPDLTVAKSDDVAGSAALGSGWTWTLHVANGGPGFASFANGDTVVADNLPNSGISYGTPTVTNASGLTGTVNCSINATQDLACTAGGAVQLNSSGSFDVTFTATPSGAGTFANPRAGGSCSVDPSAIVPETNEGNNSCSDTVTVTASDLTIGKANTIGGAGVTGQGWSWTLTTSNIGGGSATFASGQTILQDDLAGGTGVTYGTPTVANVTNVTNSGSIQCAIDASQTLTCTANGSSVTIGATTGAFDVVVPVTPTAAGSYTNPRSGGICRVDPNNAVAEGNESNNDCAPNTVTVARADTTTTITGHSPNPSVVGQTVTVQYSVTVNGPGAGTPTGNVTVSDGTDSCTSTVATGQCSITFNTTGTRTLTATYTGDGSFNGSTSAGVSHTVNQAPAITSADHTTFTVGSFGTFTVTTTGFPTPTIKETGALPNGVTFVDNGDGTATLSGTPAAGTAGSYALTITANNGVGSPALQAFTLTVLPLTYPTTTSVNSSANPSVVGQAVTFTATVTSSSGTPTGTVQFTDNGTNLGSPQPVTNGVTTLTTSSLTAGTHTITANFSGSGGYLDSSGTLPGGQVVQGQAPAITSANHTTFTVGAPGSFTVTATGVPTPSLTESGSLPSGVSFVDNHNGTATLSGTPAAGTGGVYHLTLTAHNGAGPDATQAFTLTVNQAPAVTSASSTTFTVGSAGSFTVTSTGYPIPSLSESGTLPAGVTFVAGSNGTGTLSGIPAPGTGGSYPLTFTAQNGVGSPATQHFTLTVAARTTTTSLRSSVNPSLLHQPVTFTVTVSSSGGTPGGTVTFRDGSTVLGTATLVNGTASFTTSSLGAGSHTITATYNGNGIFPTSAASLTQVVGYRIVKLASPPNELGNSLAPVTIKIQLLDARGVNVSSAAIPVTARCIVRHTSPPPTSCGSAPVLNTPLRFMGSYYQYQAPSSIPRFNPQYDVFLKVGNDPTLHLVHLNYP